MCELKSSKYLVWIQMISFHKENVNVKLRTIANTIFPIFSNILLTTIITNCRQGVGRITSTCSLRTFRLINAKILKNYGKSLDFCIYCNSRFFNEKVFPVLYSLKRKFSQNNKSFSQNSPVKFNERIKLK